MSIKPTLGRVIWYSPMGSLPASSNGYLTALICDVNPDETINLAVFDTKGNLHGRQNIVILDDDVESPVASQASHYACWMPFQKGQAQKTEQILAGIGSKEGVNTLEAGALSGSMYVTGTNQNGEPMSETLSTEPVFAHTEVEVIQDTVVDAGTEATPED